MTDGSAKTVAEKPLTNGTERELRECVTVFTEDIAADDVMWRQGFWRTVVAVRRRAGQSQVTFTFEPVKGCDASTTLAMFLRVAVWRVSVSRHGPAHRSTTTDEQMHSTVLDAHREPPERIRTFTEHIVLGDQVRYRGRLRTVVAVHPRPGRSEMTLTFEPAERGEDSSTLTMFSPVSVWRARGTA